MWSNSSPRVSLIGPFPIFRGRMNTSLAKDFSWSFHNLTAFAFSA